jgi:hypothetical protein
MLNELLKSKNFFKLRSELKNAGNKLSEERLLYYQMFCEYAFDKVQQSDECADKLLNKYGKRMDSATIVEILVVKADNYVRSYRYKEAAEMYSLLLTGYNSVSDSLEIASYQNMQNLFRALATVKPQRMYIDKDTEIKAYRNLFNHLMTPVKCGGIAGEFIFDSGANLSTVSDSCAIKMGFTVFEADIQVGTSTDVKIQTKLAVADSLYVGDILFENVVYLVTPAEQMSFPSINYEVHGIIGFPVLHQMGEIHIRKDGAIFVPKEPENRNLENIFLHGLHPVVQLSSGNDTLLLMFDTGAKSVNSFFEVL